LSGSSFFILTQSWSHSFSISEGHGLSSDGWEYCVTDGPPYDMDLIEMTMVLANVVIIPVKLAAWCCAQEGPPLDKGTRSGAA
jgi:hypothetical protein